jgi:acyl-CoA reductase-like NAD-dependent aldehyde dehydrogenase
MTQVPVVNPYGGEVVGEVPLCGPAEVDAACRDAADWLASGDFPQHARARVLDEASRLLRERIERFATTITRESGKPIRTSRVEAARCVETLAFSAAAARGLRGEMVPMEATEAGTGKLGFAFRLPIGVVAAITPFNFPLNLVAHKVGPAVAAGCPVVLKPAPPTPFSAMALVEILGEAGMPDGWVQVLTDNGSEAAAPLVEHEVPAMISFTGSTKVGWGIAAAAPRKKVALELGSNSPLVVEPDADLDAVAAKVRVAGFSHAGQSCIAVQRVIVHRSVHTELVERLAGTAEEIVLGDPMADDTEMGPLIRPAENDRVLDWVRRAEAGGARVVTGAEVTGDGILRPTVVDQPPPDSDLSTQEVFGPVVATAPYDTFEEALAMANATPVRLHAGVFTNDLAKALEAARRLDFGGVLVNEVPTFRVDHQPYGGEGDAGNTREGPPYTVGEMTRLRFVSLQ